MSTTATIEFPFEAPCADQLDGLLALAVDRGHDLPRAAARARLHTSSCARCGRALKWIDTQRRTVQQLPWSRRIDPANNGSMAIRRFENWLTRAIDQSSAELVAYAAWKVAFSIAATDHRFSTVNVPALYQLEGAALAALEDDLVASICDHEMCFSGPNCRMSHRNSVRDLATRLKGELSRIEVRDPLVFASRIVSPVRDALHLSPGRIELLQGVISWIRGKSDGVPEEFVCVASGSMDRRLRSHALVNWSIWEMDRGHEVVAGRLRSLAIAATPDEPLVLKNKLYVDAMQGNFDACHASRARLRSTALGRSVLASASTSRVLRIATGVSTVLDLRDDVRRTRTAYLLSHIVPESPFDGSPPDSKKPEVSSCP